MILVTGAAGFIGGRLVSALNGSSAMTVLPADPKFGDASILYDKVLPKYGDAIEAVFHLGAISDTTCEDKDALYKTNVDLSEKLASFCDDTGIPFIYASSASVYGNGDGPLNLYAHSKLIFDRIAEKHLRMNWWGCRFFNVYGPGEAHKGKQASLVHQMIKAQRDGEKPRLFETHTMRDFIHVDDAVEVMLWMWKHRPPSGIYDVGTGESVTIARLHDMVQDEMNISNDHVEIEMPDHLKGKYQFHTCADIRKLRDAGYSKPFIPLREGIRRMLK